MANNQLKERKGARKSTGGKTPRKQLATEAACQPGLALRLAARKSSPAISQSRYLILIVTGLVQSCDPSLPEIHRAADPEAALPAMATELIPYQKFLTI